MVERLYLIVLGRPAEEPHRTELANAFARSEISVRVQLARMFKSPEFFENYLRGRSSHEMADLLYQVILCRPPESRAALEGTAKFIEQCGWQARVDAMLNSEEYLSRFGDDRIPE